MTPEEWRQLGEAIVIRSGYGRRSFPARDDDAVVAHFGKDVADTLLPVVRQLEQEFYASEAYKLGDLAEVERTAMQDFALKHPELSEQAVRALGWCYTYDYK